MKTIKLFLVAILTISALSYSKPSQAAVAIVTGPAVATAGLIVVATGSALFVSPFIFGKGCEHDTCIGLQTAQWLGLFMVPIGLLILDGEQSVSFTKMDKASARKIGVSETERQSFNDEIDQANMLLSEVSDELEKLAEPTPQDAANAWKEIKDLVSPSTFSAMLKIASQK